MGNYYNEWDPYAAEWLRGLVDAGHIPPGVVDTSDVRDLDPADLEDYEQVHLFAGIGGWPLALELAGWPASTPLWTGSCPCQPFSTANLKKQKDDSRDLWPAVWELIRERKPALFLGEQVAGVAGRAWFDGVSSDLTKGGYTPRVVDLCASVLGYPRRRRLYFSAHPDREGKCRRPLDGKVARVQSAPSLLSEGYAPQERMDADSRGVPTPMARLRAFGNAVNPQVAALFIQSQVNETTHA